MQVSIIIPAYNEEKRLGPFLKSISNYLSSNQINIHEIIVVNDGSSDQTINIANQYAKHLPLKIISHSQNKGKGAAVQTGVLAASGDLIIFMDADGATSISELPKMISALSIGQIGIGNRWLPGSKTERHSYLRQLSGFIYRQYMRLFGLGSIDTMCGFKGYRKNVAKKLFSTLLDKRWLFDTEIAYRAVKANYSIKNFPIEWTSKDGSKLSTSTLIKSALQIWPLIRKINK